MTLDEFHLKEFLEDLDLFGGDLSAWPADKKAEAEKLLQKSQTARAHLSAMQDAERMFVAGRVTEMSNAEAVAARAMRSRQVRPSTIAVRRVSWAVAGSLALAFGLVIGIFPFGEHPSDVVGAALWSNIDVQ
jgi:hypothetical protein